MKSRSEKGLCLNLTHSSSISSHTHCKIFYQVLGPKSKLGHIIIWSSTKLTIRKGLCCLVKLYAAELLILKIDLCHFEGPIQYILQKVTHGQTPLVLQILWQIQTPINVIIITGLASEYSVKLQARGVSFYKNFVYLQQ